ncbi:MAG: DNA translocase FtsK 4TM domain-containing protein [Maricaulaceae bacterium]
MTDAVDPSSEPSVWMRARRISLGFVVFAIAGCGLGCLMTFSALDPSWNAAADGPIQNLFGGVGAVAADLLLQSLGWGAGAAVAGAALFGALVVTRASAQAPQKLLSRFLALLAGATALCMIVAALPIPRTWPFASGLGGVLGDMLYAPAVEGLARLGAPGARAWVNGLGLIIIIACAVYAFQLRWRHAAEAAETAKTALSHVATTLFRDPTTDRATDRDDPQDEADTPVAVAPKPRSKPKAKAKKREKPRIPPLEDDLDAPPIAIRAPEARKNRAHARSAPPHQDDLPFDAAAPYEPPSVGLLAKPRTRIGEVDGEMLQRSGQRLMDVCHDFGVKGEVKQIRPGPVVTLYEFEPAPGVKSARVINLADDVARSMSAASARIAVVPGRNALGVELPNRRRETVYLRSLYEADEFVDTRADLPLALGETIDGEPFIADLARMPHLLIAGTTGSGKSVGVNAMILSLLYRLTPEQCKFIMIDPKMLELSIYDGIPHLLSPVVTDPKKAVTALKWTVKEMEARYRKMSKLGVRNIAGYNARVAEAAANGETLERKVQTGYDEMTGKPLYESELLPLDPMPFIVVVIDEMADLMIVAGKEIEGAVQRLAQMARAAGIHLNTATQRPSVDVITGTIKANFPTRISFQVTSKIDSRTILGEQGGEQLLGQGDMLYRAAGGRIRRLHGAFVSDAEVEAIANHLRDQGQPDYLDDVTRDDDEGGGEAALMDSDVEASLYDQAVAIVTRDRKASTSYLQRRLQIGYNRAANLIEQMEEQGVISPANHAGKREILAPEPPEY